MRKPVHAAASLALTAILTLGLAPGCDDGGGGSVFLVCPSLDLVFVMDTSGSMGDEGVALCNSIDDVQAQLAAEGADLEVTILGITEDADDDSDFPCLTDNVADLLGEPVPGADDEIDDSEDWGPATAVVAARFPWKTDSLRVVVPISDEDPQDGDDCFDPGSDRDAVENAIAQAQANDVILSPISADQSETSPDQDLTCVVPLMRRMADATGGQLNESVDPDSDLAGAIVSLLEAACTETRE